VYNTAVPGDIFYVFRGTYNEQIVIAIDNITFQGSSHPSLNIAENNATITHAVTASNDGNDASCLHYLLLPVYLNVAHTTQQRFSSQHPISNYTT
jgi:hypothetical protein